MRFMVMHKMTEELERGLAPEPAVLEGIGRLVQDGLKDGVFVSGEGLRPSAERVHVAYEGGKRTLTRGPFREPQELVAGFALLRVRSEEEALSCCDRLSAVTGDAELYVGPVVEPWHLGMVPKPKNPPRRFLATRQADAQSESDATPDPALAARMAALVEELTRSGVLQATGALGSTKKGARIHFDGGSRTIIDGPFAESKELVAGYAILELPSKAAALEWAVRFGEIVKVHEIELRELAG
jgi:hypothetical protein